MRVNDVEFVYGGHAEFSANLITENMFSQGDARWHILHPGPLNHRCSHEERGTILHGKGHEAHVKDNPRMGTVHRMEGQVNLMGKVEQPERVIPSSGCGIFNCLQPPG